MGAFSVKRCELRVLEDRKAGFCRALSIQNRRLVVKSKMAWLKGGERFVSLGTRVDPEQNAVLFACF